MKSVLMSIKPKYCDHFKLDFDTLTRKQQKAVKRILSHEDDEY